MPATVATTMTAVEIVAPGGPEVLVAREYPVPVPGAGEVLVRVSAAGVNRPDVLQRLGGYNPPPGASPLPGLEIAGEIVTCAPGVTAFAPGNRVCALLSGGGYAEYAAVPVEQCLPIPAGFTDVEAAAIPETFFTVWSNIFDRAHARAGEALLVHGGGSGIGSTAIQLGDALGLTVYATAGDDAKCRAVEALGARRCVNYRDEDFVAAIRDATGGAGVDIVLDIVGGDYMARNLELLRMDGRLVQIGMLGSNEATIPLGPVMRKRVSITGSMLRPRTPAEKGVIAAQLREHVWPLFESGRIKPAVARTFSLADAAGAHRLMESGAFVGKIVLEVA